MLDRFVGERQQQKQLRNRPRSPETDAMKIYRQEFDRLQSETTRAYNRNASTEPKDHPELLAKMHRIVGGAFAGFRQEVRSGPTPEGHAGEGAHRIVPVVAAGLMREQLRTAAYRSRQPYAQQDSFDG